MIGKKNLPLAFLAALILGALGLWMVRARQPHTVAVGEPAASFELATLGGKASLRDFQGQVVVLNFWATWCPPCVEETPSLEKFAEQMRPQGVAVIGVSVDQDTAQLEKFVAHHHL